FLLEVVESFLSYFKIIYGGEIKVLDFHHLHHLLEGFEGFNLELSDLPEPLEQILADYRDTIKYRVKPDKAILPTSINFLSGLDIGLAGEWLTATANTNVFTCEIAPVFAIMDQILLKKIHEMVGWREFEADGIFSPG
ncbi:DCE1 decarboxylase, partial [Pluvianellus socialis]|nr:DCE1 decarboxylase [Pluvianellus socialis]